MREIYDKHKDGFQLLFGVFGAILLCLPWPVALIVMSIAASWIFGELGKKAESVNVSECFLPLSQPIWLFGTIIGAFCLLAGLMWV